jgi:hypothetical protein
MIDPMEIQERQTSKVLMIQLILFFFSQILLFFFLRISLYSVVLQERLPEEILTLTEVERDLRMKEIQETFQSDIDKNPESITKEYIRILFDEKPGILFFNSIFWGISFIIPSYYFLRKKYNLECSDLSDPFQWAIVNKGLAAATMAFLLVMVVTGSMNAMGMKLKNNEFQSLLFQKLHQNTALLSWSLYSVSLLTGIFEEWYFRGILLKNYIGMGQAESGLFITSVLFGLAHYSPESSIVIPFIMVIIGFIFGYIYKVTGNIWINISSHVFYNGFGLLVAYFFGDKLI